MKIHYPGDDQFIHPYRQNPRCFNKYFNKNHHLLHESYRKTQPKRQAVDFLDNVSRASSVKIRQSPFENQPISQNKIPEEPSIFRLTKTNKKIDSFLQNPEIYNLISKHVQKDQLLSNKKTNNFAKKKTRSEHSSRFEKKSFSIDQLKKTPKITEFTRQTFYCKSSASKLDFSSKKQNQDRLHSNSNTNINSQKISLFKRTSPWKEKNTFATCQIYSIKKRIGIDASIIRGRSEQIKFRLILNQFDTKTFQSHWNENPQQFVERCVIISENGIKLKLGVFNVNNHQSKLKMNQIKQTPRKTYLKEYLSFTKSKIRQKHTPIRVGSIAFCQLYKDKMQTLQITKVNNDEKGKSHPIIRETSFKELNDIQVDTSRVIS